MIAGVNRWAKAFEAAGFKDAIRGEILPDSVDPEDIRYATLRWSTSDEPGYGAIGPSIVDPRTGEILDADLLFEANMVQGFRYDWGVRSTADRIGRWCPGRPRRCRFPTLARSGRISSCSRPTSHVLRGHPPVPL